MRKQTRVSSSPNEMEGSSSEEMVVIRMLAFGCSDKAFQSTTVCKNPGVPEKY